MLQWCKEVDDTHKTEGLRNEDTKLNHDLEQEGQSTSNLTSHDLSNKRIKEEKFYVNQIKYMQWKLYCNSSFINRNTMHTK